LPHDGWSSAVVSLAKALEVETNGSIIQRIREARSNPGASQVIRMHEDYRRFRPGAECLVETSQADPVDLNASRGAGDGWSALPLGQLSHVIRAVPGGALTLGASSALCRALDFLVDPRNGGAHRDELTREVAEGCRSKIISLLNDGTVEEMCVLKQRVSGS